MRFLAAGSFTQGPALSKVQLSDVEKKENLTEGILQPVIDQYQIDAVDWKVITRI